MAICKHCREGADFLTDVLLPPRVDVDPLVRSVALTAHSRCKGCDCQHKVDRQLDGKSVAR